MKMVQTVTNQDSQTEKVYTMTNKFWLYINFGKPIVTCEIKNLYKEIPEKLFRRDGKGSL